MPFNRGIRLASIDGTRLPNEVLPARYNDKHGYVNIHFFRKFFCFVSPIFRNILRRNKFLNILVENLSLNTCRGGVDND